MSWPLRPVKNKRRIGFVELFLSCSSIHAFIGPNDKDYYIDNVK